MAKLPRSQRDANNKAQADTNALDQALAALNISDRAPTPSASADGESGAKLTKSEKKDRLYANIIQYFDDNYGRKENRLEAWQKLCQHVGVEEGASIKACKKNLRKVYINIVDFVAAQQGGRPFKRFGSYTALRCYILRTHKIFPLALAKDSPILRWMLIKVF